MLFGLDIVRQRWIHEPIREDLCSHGRVRLTFGGVSFEAEDYGLVQSGLGLLRTLEVLDRIPRAPDVGKPYVMPHGCGFPGGACSNFGTDWRVIHETAAVVLTEIRHIETPMRPVETVPGNIRVPLTAYRDAIVRFASEVRRFYVGSGPKIADERWEADLATEVWHEYDERLAAHGGPDTLPGPAPFIDVRRQS